MPITGLTTTKDFTLSRALPLLGRIYKGGAKRTRTGQGGKSYEIFGEDLTYFRVEFSPEYQHLQAAWNKIYGAEPDCFTITFMGDTVDEVFPTWYEQHAASTLLHRCDGVTQVRWWDAQARDGMGSYSDQPRACQNTGDAGGSSGSGCKCAKVGNLNFILPDLFEATSQLGFFRLTTHSTHDLIALYNALKLIEKTMGRLTGVPFILGRQTQKVSAPDGKGGRRNLEKSLLYIRVEDTFARNVLQPMLRGAAAPALPAGTPTSAPAVNTPELPATFTNGNAIDDEALDGEIIDPGDAPAAPAWYNEENLRQLVAEFKALSPSTTVGDILMAAGFSVTTSTTVGGCNWGKFASYAEARATIAAELNRRQPDEAPPAERTAGGDDMVLAFALAQIKAAFGWSVEDFEKLVGKPLSAFDSGKAVWVAAQNTVRRLNLSMIATQVTWQGSYALLNTDLPTRAYGQSNSNLLLSLGDKWKPFVDSWEKDQTYTLPEPVLVLTWQQANGYALAKSVMLLPDAEADAEAAAEDDLPVSIPQQPAGDGADGSADKELPPGFVRRRPSELWVGQMVYTGGQQGFIKTILREEGSEDVKLILMTDRVESLEVSIGGREYIAVSSAIPF